MTPRATAAGAAVVGARRVRLERDRVDHGGRGHCRGSHLSGQRIRASLAGQLRHV